MASGAIGMCVDEFNGDNFDHGPHGFVGGGYMGAIQTGGRPILGTRTPPGTPSWGAKWKKAVADNYLSSYETMAHGSSYSYRDAYCDLDPTYTDRLGRKLMRITFDFHENELKMSQYLTDRLAEIVQKMEPRQLVKLPRKGPYTSTVYQTTHVCGGAVIGTPDMAIAQIQRLIGDHFAPHQGGRYASPAVAEAQIWRITHELQAWRVGSRSRSLGLCLHGGELG